MLEKSCKFYEIELFFGRSQYLYIPKKDKGSKIRHNILRLEYFPDRSELEVDSFLHFSDMSEDDIITHVYKNIHFSFSDRKNEFKNEIIHGKGIPNKLNKIILQTTKNINLWVGKKEHTSVIENILFYPENNVLEIKHRSMPSYMDGKNVFTEYHINPVFSTHN